MPATRRPARGDGGPARLQLQLVISLPLSPWISGSRIQDQMITTTATFFHPFFSLSSALIHNQSISFPVVYPAFLWFPLFLLFVRIIFSENYLLSFVLSLSAAVFRFCLPSLVSANRCCEWGVWLWLVVAALPARTGLLNRVNLSI